MSAWPSDYAGLQELGPVNRATLLHNAINKRPASKWTPGHVQYLRAIAKWQAVNEYPPVLTRYRLVADCLVNEKPAFVEKSNSVSFAQLREESPTKLISTGMLYPFFDALAEVQRPKSSGPSASIGARNERVREPPQRLGLVPLPPTSSSQAMAEESSALSSDYVLGEEDLAVPDAMDDDLTDKDETATNYLLNTLMKVVLSYFPEVHLEAVLEKAEWSVLQQSYNTKFGILDYNAVDDAGLHFCGAGAGVWEVKEPVRYAVGECKRKFQGNSALPQHLGEAVAVIKQKLEAGNVNWNDLESIRRFTDKQRTIWIICLESVYFIVKEITFPAMWLYTYFGPPENNDYGSDENRPSTSGTEGSYELPPLFPECGSIGGSSVPGHNLEFCERLSSVGDDVHMTELSSSLSEAMSGMSFDDKQHYEDVQGGDKEPYLQVISSEICNLLVPSRRITAFKLIVAILLAVRTDRIGQRQFDDDFGRVLEGSS